MGRHAVLSAQTVFVHGNLQEVTFSVRSGLLGMPRELSCTIADFIPGGFFRNKFMKGVTNDRVVIQTMRVDRKGRFGRKRFSQRGPAPAAKGPDIGEWRIGHQALNVRLAAYQFELLPTDEYEGCCTQFPAAGTMTRSHHRGHSLNGETDRTATTTT